jgi:MOSC domain-containing protein YiiM
MPTVLAVCARAGHHFSKTVLPAIELVAGIGVAGDGHAGTTVQHRSRVALDPTKPNLRQVHLMHAELFDDLAARGYRVQPGDLGENVTTRDVDLLGLPTGTVLRLGPHARVQVTGLRNPCTQLDAFAPGLMKALLERRPDGVLVRKSGVMAIVLEGGRVAPGDAIEVERPEQPWHALAPV